MSTSRGKKRFETLGIRKNERPDEMPTTVLTESDITTDINDQTEITKKDEEYNVKENKQEDIKPQKKKKTNNSAYRNATFIIEQNLHRDFKILAANLSTNMVDMLDEAMRLYINIRSRENLSEEFENGKTVTDIVFEALSEK